MFLKRSFLFSTYIFVFIAYFVHVNVFPIPEEFYFNTTQFIQKYGYNSQQHEIQAEDGSIVTIFRIVPASGKISPKPFLLLGGIFCNSDVFVMYGPKHDLAFSLVEAGYDVWLLNDRGTRYGILGKDGLFNGYDYFGYHEIGINELRSSIDYTLNKTEAKKVAVAGISAGSASILVLLSERPEYNEKISLTLHFGSALSFNTSSYDSKIVGYGVATFSNFLRFSRFLSYFEGRAILMHILLGLPLGFHTFAKKGIGNLHTSDRSVQLLLTHGVSENCYGSMRHLLDNSRAQGFFKRDYGPEVNLKLYNCTSPPLYDLSNVTAPSKVYFSEIDSVSENELTKLVFSRLNNNLGGYVVKAPFGHFQFITECTASNQQLVKEIIKTLHQASFD